MASIRTRFAPSPSGFLHIGGARTALFNYLYARRHGGTFVLRVEDTDRERSTPESIAAIFESLRWLALEWDEGPFFQSERTALYREHAERLLAAGKAYRCFCSAAEIDEMRRRAQSGGGGSAYDRRCRTRTDAPTGQPYTVRFKAPLDGETSFDDAVRGRVSFRNTDLDDLIILRSDGSPTYNFCVVVDDAEMRITDIIRGEDHISNTPRQILIYAALGFALPRFAHLPLILGLDGGRLSKRHGATSVTAYRDLGFLPDAVNNYLARLGWSHGDQEIFNRAELIAHFSLEHVGSSAGVFNPEKLSWVNFQHLKSLPAAELAQALRPFLSARGWSAPDDAWLQRLAVTLQERAKTLVELVDAAAYFFTDEIKLDANAAAKFLQPAIAPALGDLRTGLAVLTDWSVATIQTAFDLVLQRYDLKLGKLAQPVRVALTGGTVSPGIYEVAELLGRERTLHRLDAAIAKCGK
jgi:glutamyl-tRNA synthetase